MKGRRLRFDFQKLNKYLLLGVFVLLFESLWGQEITIQNEEGKALIGVFVFSSDNQFSATSDEEGKLQLQKDIVYPLYFSYLGYKDLMLDQKQIEEREFLVVLESDDLIFEEVVLIGRTNMAKEDLAYETSTIQSADIQLTASQTSADALQANAGVFVQKSQMGGGSPVVRGFEANKLLLVVDGVRMNNTIYRSGHLQNAITVDPSILGSMELIFGPGSLMYGSDALGGVIHFRSKDILLAEATKKKNELGYSLRYGSSNEEKAFHVDYTYSGKRWGSLSSVTISDFGDLQIGKNRASKYPADYGLRKWYVIPGDGTQEDQVVENDRAEQLKFTAYRQYDFLQKFKFQLSDRLSLVWNNQFSTSSNIPRYDALTELRNGEPRYSSWNYGPQRRLLSSLNAKYVAPDQLLYDKVQLIVAYQNVKEIRLTSRYKTDLIAEQNEGLNILNTTLDFSKEKGSHRFYYGLDGNYNVLNSRAFEQKYGEETKTEAGLTRYPNGLGKALSTGAYAQYYFLSDSWYKLNVGVRYDFNQVDIRFEQDNVFNWPSYFYEGIQNRNHSLNGSLGFQVDLLKNINMRGLIGSAFRAPNIDDIAKIRLKSDEISVPNDQLESEKSLSGELGINLKNKASSYNVTAFYTHLTDAIVRQDYTLPDGQSTYITEGDTFNIVANVNNDNAIIRGISLTVDQYIYRNLNMEASFNVVKGKVINEGENDRPLAHIPPTYGNVFLKYEKSRWTIRSGVRFNGFKSLEEYGGSTDNPEFATARGSESWYIINAVASYKLNPAFTFQLGIDNILDQFYVPFASGVPGAGRHIHFTLRGNL